MKLNLSDEALPLVLSPSDGVCFRGASENDEVREPVIPEEIAVRQEALALFDHLKLGHLNLFDLLLHAALVALTDHSDYEVHEDDVPDNKDKEPDYPS